MFYAFLVSSDSTGLLPELCIADHPQIRAHRSFAVCVVLLGVERCEVGRDLAQVVPALRHSTGHLRKTRTYQLLVRSDGCRAFHFLAQIQAVAIAAHGRCYAVRTEQHLRAAVLTVLTGFAQCAGYTVDTGTPFYFCHFVSVLFCLAPYEGFRLKILCSLRRNSIPTFVPCSAL